MERTIICVSRQTVDLYVRTDDRKWTDISNWAGTNIKFLEPASGRGFQLMNKGGG